MTRARAGDPQLGLFGAGVAGPSLGPVPPPDPHLATVAAALPSRLAFGTSSWTFPGWRDVYRTRGLARDAGHVNNKAEGSAPGTIVALAEALAG